MLGEPDEAELARAKAFEGNGPCDSNGWARFGMVRGAFIAPERLPEARQDPEAYAKAIGIAEPPVAVLMRAMFPDGDEVRCLVATESKVYQLMYANA